MKLNLFNDSKLKKCSDSIPMFSLKDEFKKCKVVDVYDGDTCKVVFYLHGKLYKWNVRMVGYDSPEMRPPLNNPYREDIKQKAVLSRNYLSNLVQGHEKLVYIKCGEFDKYGRLLGKIYLNKDNDKSVNDMMIENKYGKPYDGKSKRN